MDSAAQASLFKSYTIRACVREVWKKRETLTPSQWAARYRTVTMGAHVGPWRNDITPYLPFIMDTFMQAVIREGVICGSPQTGKTETPYNCLAQAMDIDPSNMMVVMPSQDVSGKVAEDRIIPMIRESSRLKELISSNPDDTSKRRVKLSNGARLYMAWSNSPSALATFPIKYLVFDECDKYPPTVGKETDPMTLGEKRVRTFRHTHKIFKVSTPTREDGPIWKSLQRCDVIYHFHAKCPDCAHEQPFHLDNLRQPEGVKPEEIRRNHLGRYECRACFKQWTDYERDMAVRAGSWKRAKGESIEKPRSVGFHLPSWLSPDVSLSEIAEAWIIAKKDRTKLIDFYNDYLAEPYIEQQSERKEDSILALKDDRPRGTVPRDISTLILLADTQQRGFYYEVAAFGWGSLLESWQVREGYVETFEALTEVLEKSEYRDADGRAYVIQAAFIDSGGGTGAAPKHSRTAEVYEYCRSKPVFRPLKGRQRLNTPFSPTRIDFYPGPKKVPIPGGLTLYNINVTYFKDQLNTKLGINSTDPGAFHLHSETTEDYAKQMTAEYRNDKGVWICPQGKANHYWDLGVYRMAAAEILQIKFWKKPEDMAARPTGRRVLSKGVEN